MRVLVVSDIHANRPALQAIREDTDAIVCLGDIVSYGPFPRECVAWVRERATYAIRGNHDTALSHGVESGAAAFKRALAVATIERHRSLLPDDDLAWLRELPIQADFRFDDYRFHAVHASPMDPLYSYRFTPELPDEELKKEVESVRADIVLLGHTHLPMSRGAWTKVVVNPGSVGQPLDGDPRASYAVIEDGVAEIRRVEYDVEETVAGIRRLGLAGEMAQALIGMLRTGKPTGSPEAGAGGDNSG